MKNFLAQIFQQQLSSFYAFIKIEWYSVIWCVSFGNLFEMWKFHMGTQVSNKIYYCECMHLFELYSVRFARFGNIVLHMNPLNTVRNLRYFSRKNFKASSRLLKIYFITLTAETCEFYLYISLSLFCLCRVLTVFFLIIFSLRVKHFKWNTCA